MLVAVSLLGFAGWQAMQIAVTGHHRTELIGPPAKARSDGRGPSPRELAMKDPVATYIARANRGMTDREIRWIDEDFRAAGLDHVPDSQDSMATHRAFRVRQQRWYLEAVSEGLSLSKAQRQEVEQALARLLTSEFEVPGASSFQVTMGTSLGFWLWQEAYAPWNLCHLTPAQTALTTKGTMAASSGIGEINRWEWPFPVIQDPTTGQETEFQSEPGEGARDLETLYLPASGIFPLTPAQTLPVPDNPEVRTLPADKQAQARLLQPVQYRMALLVGQSVASELVPR